MSNHREQAIRGGDECLRLLEQPELPSYTTHSLIEGWLRTTLASPRYSTDSAYRARVDRLFEVYYDAGKAKEAAKPAFDDRGISESDKAAVKRGEEALAMLERPFLAAKPAEIEALLLAAQLNPRMGPDRDYEKRVDAAYDRYYDMCVAERPGEKARREAMKGREGSDYDDCA